MRQKVLTLLRAALGLGISPEDTLKISGEDLRTISHFARKQGLMAIISDGFNALCEKGLADGSDMPEDIAITWISATRETEMRYENQLRYLSDTARILESSGIRTYQLKGAVFAECYPTPEHRRSSDADCFTVFSSGGKSAWEKANVSMENTPGCTVSRGYYKHSSFHFDGMKIENHQFLTPFRGDRILTAMERLLQELIRNDKEEDRIKGTAICRPPVLVSALFLVEHAYSHFLSEGLKIQHITDWIMFRRKHEGQIDMVAFNHYIDKFRLRAFYDSFCKAGEYLCGKISEDGLDKRDRLLIDDMWKGPSGSEVTGIKGKLNLARNVFAARWKYREFSYLSMPHALFIKTIGFLFQQNPKI